MWLQHINLWQQRFYVQSSVTLARCLGAWVLSWLCPAASRPVRLVIVVISHSLASAPSLIVLGLLIQLVTGFSLVLNLGVEPNHFSLALLGITFTCEALPSLPAVRQQNQVGLCSPAGYWAAAVVYFRVSLSSPPCSVLFTRPLSLQSPCPSSDVSSATHRCSTICCPFQTAMLKATWKEPEVTLARPRVALRGRWLHVLLLRSQDLLPRPRPSTSPSLTASTRRWPGSWCRQEASGPTWTILKSSVAASSRVNRPWPVCLCRWRTSRAFPPAKRRGTATCARSAVRLCTWAPDTGGTSLPLKPWLPKRP